ncbi:MAG: S8 family serine peptidase [Bacillota bacterium]
MFSVWMHRRSSILWLLAVFSIALVAVLANQMPEETAVEAVSVSHFAPADVEGHWAARDILLLQRMGAIDAYPDGVFRPDQPITRAEMVKMMVSAFGVMRVRPADPTREVVYPESTYLDVDETHWVRSFVYSAYEEDLVSGYPDGTFQPDAGLTRAEMAGLFHRIFSSPQPEGTPDTAEELPEWAAEAVAWCLEVDLFRGFPDGTFRPGQMTTRAQAVVLLRRALELRGSLYTLSGEVLEVSSLPPGMKVRLAGDQVVEVGLGGAPLYRGDSEIPIEEIPGGAYVNLLINDHGEVIWADVPHVSLTAVLQSVSFSDSRLRVRPLSAAGEDGALSSWNGTAFWSAAADLGPLTAGDSVNVYWDADTEFFRQGSSALVHDLRPGDRIYLSLRPDSPVLRHVDAVRYDSWGLIRRVDRTGGVIEWTTESGETVSGQVTANSRFDAGGSRVDFQSLRAGLHLGVVRGRGTSQIIYAEVFGLQGAASRPRPEFDGWQPVEIPRLPSTEPGPHRESEIGEAMSAVAGMLGIIDIDEYSQTEVSNNEVIGASALRELLDVDGGGVLVAVVDTGVDPLVRGLFTGRGGPVVWRDFTGSGDAGQRAGSLPGARLAEGDVLTKNEIYVSDREFHFQNSRFVIEGVRPFGGVLRCGWVDESFFFPEGSSRERILVAALRTAGGGVYDAVYVDTDGNGILTGDELFTAVDRGGAAGTVVFSSGSAVNFVVTEMDRQGRLVNLGFDGNGHGTQVAGVVAAAGGDYGEGVAPGAGLMVFKALTSAGGGSWENVVRAVRYAALAGADIINVSVTGLHDLSSGSSRESQMLAEIAQTHDVLIVTAVGNSGPGLATAYTPGDSRWTLSVGAAALPEIVRRDYGYVLPEPAVWQYSSVGPRADGALAPSVLGPGSTYTPVPVWMFPRGWGFFEGTSCAAAHVTGVAALLVEAARELDLGATMQGVKRAIEEGSTPLSGYLPVEQGFGVIDAAEAWRHLVRDPRAVSRISLGVSSGIMVERPSVERDPQGVYLRQTAAGTLHMILQNPGDVSSRVALEVDGLTSVSAELENLILPGNARLSVPMHYGLPAGRTIESGFLIADDSRTPGVDARLLHTLLNPVVLSAERPQLYREGRLSPGKWDRHFLSVPEGASHLNVTLQVTDAEAGRVSFQIVSPGGRRVYVSPSIGAGSYSSSGEPVVSASRVIERPEAGVWEVIVSSASSLSFYGLDHSTYQFRAAVLARGTLVLAPGRTDWRFSGPEATPDYVDTSVRIAVGGNEGEATALLDSLRPVGRGWLDSPDDVTLVPRQWFSTAPGESRYIDFEVAAGVSELTVWCGNLSIEEAGVELFLYRQLHDGGMEEVLQSRLEGDGQFLSVHSPIPGTYMLVTRPKAEQVCEYEVAAYAWPRARDIQVNGPALGSDGYHYLHVRLAVPPHQGNYWALVGLQNAAGEILAQVWLHAEVGCSPVVLSPAPFISPLADPVLVVRESETLRPAGGVVLIDDRLYTLDEDGTINMSAPYSQGRLSSFEVRFNSGEDEWSTPVRLSAPVLSRAELVEWRQGLLSLLSDGSYENPIIQARWEYFFALPADNSNITGGG